MSYEVSLDALGTSYSIPEAGQTNYANDLSLYLRDLATVVNDASGGSLVTPVFNVRTYGATGNGSTDDTVAINLAKAALLAASSTGGTLYFPAGTYKTSSTLQFGVSAAQSNVRVVGDGPNSIIKPTGAFSATPVIEFRDCNYWVVQDIKIDASARTGSGDNILVDGCSYGYCTNSTIVNSTRYGVNITQVSGASPSTYNVVNANVFSGNTTANTNVSPVAGVLGNVANDRTGIFPPQYIDVKNYGATGDGVTDDTASLLRALAVLVARGGRSVLYFPAGTYLLTSQLDFSGLRGFRIVGEAMEASIIKWNGSAGVDVIYAMGSQLWGIENLTLLGKAASRPASMIHSRMATGYTYAAYGITFTNLEISGLAGADEFDYGIRFSTDGAGNNSEVTYNNVIINYCKESAVRISGSQAKAHRFYNFQAALGERGIDCAEEGFGAPAFSMHSGNFALFSEAAMKLSYPGDPCLIEDVQAESNFRFFDYGAGTPTDAAQAVNIKNCRIDCSQNSASGAPPYSTYIRYAGSGPFIFEGNMYTGASSGIPQIGISASGAFSGEISRNHFQSDNSVSTSPLNWNTANVGPASQCRMDANTFLNAAGNTINLRMEAIDAVPPTNMVVANIGPPGQYPVLLFNDLWTAAALTQTVSFPLPQGVRIKSMTFYNNQKVALPAAPAITIKAGSTSGGDEYLLDTDVSLTDATLYDDPTLLGTNLTTDFRPGGYIPDYFAGTTVYLTMTSAAGNLGTGAATNITSGQLFLLLEADISTRWLRVG